MSVFSWLFGSGGPLLRSPVHTTNPANGLPMLNDAVDVAGNPFGTDLLANSHSESADWMHDVCASTAVFDPPADFGCSGEPMFSNDAWD